MKTAKNRNVHKITDGIRLAIVRYSRALSSQPLFVRASADEDLSAPDNTMLITLPLALLLTPPPLAQSRCIGTPPLPKQIELHRATAEARG